MSKKLFLLLFIIFTVAGYSQYITPNTGVHWNLDSLVSYSAGVVSGTFPNYTITNKITISANDRVEIAPGTIVSFTAAASGFDVNGIFKASGTVNDSIIFTSPIEDSTGSYEGFRFNDSSVDTACMIRYARIQFADYGMRCIDASPAMLNCFVYKCGRPVQLTGSSPLVKGNRIERAFEYGITMTLGSSPLIEDNIFALNNTQNTSAKNQISIGLQGNNSPVIRNNIIYGGTSTVTGGISLWVSGASAFSDAIIEGNEIYNNSFGITLYSTSNGIINAVVKNNKIYNNNLNPNAQVSGSGINVNGSAFNKPIIKNNEIFGNWWGITIQNGTTVQAGPQPNIGNIENADTTDDGMNIIYDNVQGTTVYDLYNNCTNDVTAQNNDWRVYDSLSIEQHIFHKADNSLHGLVKFTPFSLFLPVELLSFTALVANNNIVLNWQTASEINNRGFEIERSQTSNVKGQTYWKIIGFIDGKGTSSEFNNYSFLDTDVASGKYLYRLKQIDFDGSIKYSNTIEIEFFVADNFVLYQNYPNPFNPATTISWLAPVSTHQTLKIYDMLGNEIATLADELKDAGVYEIELDASAFASGVYYYQLKTDSFIKTNKMILLK